MAGWYGDPLMWILLCFCAISVCYGQVLTPRTFNLAKGRQITASATCGDFGPELYCRLTGATGDEEVTSREIIQGQLCDYCDASDPRRNHTAANAIDGTEKWWQSPPLSRGMKFNNIELTIDLGQEFHIAYVIVKMANSPRPGTWALEKSDDYGKTWQAWQYFADTPLDCKKFFSAEYKTQPQTDNDVLCVTDFSKIVPLNNGEIFISLTNNRPNAHNFSYADDLKAFMKATNVRMRLLRTKTLLGHLMAVATQDSTVTRRYFYSIKDISLGGRCVCNGHASTCNYIDLTRPDRLICDCQHNTVGDQCELCDAANGYVQKKWQPARANSAFECEPCQCYGRTTQCQYNADVDAKGLSIDIHGYYSGGGVCQNCDFNSTGINCEKCLPGFFRPHGTPLTRLDMCQECVCDPHFHINECEDETGRCQCRPEYTGDDCDSCSAGYYGYPDCIPCDCDVNGTEGDVCQVNGGQCPCKPNYIGKNCDMCQLGFYNFPECTVCNCDSVGSSDNYCDLESGQCKCHLNYGNRNCSECAYGYYNFPDCTLCSCDIQGTLDQICDADSGKCLCKETFNGGRCDACARGYYGYPNCMDCECKETGSLSNVCEDRYGQCQCRPNFGGRNCDRCAPGFYRYPDCVPCNCDGYGSLGSTCEKETGQCDCLFNFRGRMCDKCKEGLYNYPNCEECNCNPAGAQQVPGYPLGGCGEVVTGRLCECKEQVTGRICDTCKPGYWNLNRNNPVGCEKCTCSDAGTIGGRNLCNMFTGQCMCKVDVSGRNCDRCKDGYFNLNRQNLYGCQECNCDLGGSRSLTCDKMTGQCPCKPRVEGLRCDQPLRQHFFPSLDQLKYEIEDGYTPEGAQVKYGYDERVFANFSWRGYAILMERQPEVRFDLDIRKPSLYRLIYRFVNRNNAPVIGQVKLSPFNVDDVPQESEISFAPSTEPSFANVGNVKGLSNFVLNPGRWTISIRTDSSVFLDYMILVPQSYYEATVLQNLVYRPCSVPGDTGPCIHYSYPDVVDYPRVMGEDGYILIDGQRVPIELFFDQDILEELDITNMGVLKPDQTTFNLDLYIPKEDKYVLILNYYSNVTSTQTLLFNISGNPATAVLYPCAFSSLCRQVLLDMNEMEGVFKLAEGYHNLTVQGSDDVFAGIESVVAIPYSVWSMKYVKPSIICIRVNGRCVNSRYSIPVGSLKIEFEALPNDHLVAMVYPPRLDDTSIKLVRMNSTIDVIVLLGSVPEPGTYKFLVHYYLPYGTGERMPITLFANGKEYKGDFNPQYCPGTNGCRGLLLFDESGSTGNVDMATTDVKVVFNNTSGQDIWLDYMLMIPSSQYSGQDITLRPLDNSKNFIDTCLEDGFRIRTPVSDFCERSLFTLTTEFNNGALECECNIDGSLNFMCDQYGGQCTCKPNVIGRICSACRVGYYGFPRCQPCNCPFGLCHQVTGKCICPPRVTGDRCDVCQPGTYGYDPLVGCQECQCNPQGVVDEDINCDETSGQCRCKPGVGGRRCDYCLAGFFDFPNCQECDCDRDGTTAEICDAGNSFCFCKANVMGERCDQCEPFTYNLDAVNPAGCTSCFCFGNTAVCAESSLHWDVLMDMVGWRITNTADGVANEYGTTVAVLNMLEKITDPDESIYWIAPEAYLGNRVTSYGGFLLYKIMFALPRNESVVTEAVLGPDMVLQGNNQTLYYRSSKQPISSSVTNMKIQLLEFNFEYPDTGAKVDRDDFMLILANVQSIHLRAAYYSLVEEVRLQEVGLDIATSLGSGEVALSVEQCECPRGYTGTSCEDCAIGYYRGRHFPYFGICVPCDCNGHATTCDLHTGECINCRNNTQGAHCDTCLPGYYGYPSYGEACHICGCPLQLDSNNFADTCLVVAGGIVASCDCYPGYAGEKCERCASGYYGNPEIPGDTCKMCNCSDNINMNNPDACDPDTGECLTCINNSTGPRCERCKDWWYGDAVTAKDCYPCSCDQCGSLMCNSEQGQCTCKPNVIGINCDRCAPNTYGFDNCNGCLSCDCAEASKSSQCEEMTGKCTCQDGVTGHRCESCIQGYWNYQETGCQLCECEYDGAVTCDPEDGRCQCLPGVTGSRCDTCLDRWVLIPQQGCQECDTCTHNLLDDMDYLNNNITAVEDSLQTVSVGVGAMKRLNMSYQAIEDLRPQVISVLYESENITLDPLAVELNQIEVITQNVFGRTVGSMTSAKGLMTDGETLHNNSLAARTLAMQSEHNASDAIVYISDILRQINEGIKVTNIEIYIEMTEKIITTLRSRNFSEAEMMSSDELDFAEESMKFTNEKKIIPLAHKKYLETITEKLLDISGRLADLQNNSQVAEGMSTSTKNRIKKIQQDVITSISQNVEAIKGAASMTQDTLKMAHELNMQSEYNVNVTDQEFMNISQVQGLVMQGRAALNIFINKKEQGNEHARIAVNESWDHANSMEEQAVILESVYMDTRMLSLNAVLAGTAYDHIVKATEDAKDAAMMAMEAAEEAKLNSAGVGEASKNLTMSSEFLLTEAQTRYNTTQIGLFERLGQAKDRTGQIENMNKEVKKSKDTVAEQIKMLPIGTSAYKNKVNSLNEDINKSNEKVQSADAKVKDILVNLPGQLDKTIPLATQSLDANRDIKLARTQVDGVNRVIPDIRMLLTDLTGKVDGIQEHSGIVKANIDALKEKIAIARNQANLIRVGLTFMGNTSVTLRNPPNVAQAGSYSEVSLFFKTEEENGLLLYAGSDRSADNRPNQDYMSLEIKDGQVVYKYNLGRGVTEITHPHYVADGLWYKVIASRVGKAGTLTLERDLTQQPPLGSVTGKARNLTTVLEMHPLTTKFYAGGLPEATSISSQVTRSNFVGQMESVYFDDALIGLWNFEAAENNFVGARERTILTSIASNGFRFDGMGYVILSAKQTGWKPAVKSQINLRFKTYAPNGLLFFAGDNNRDFISIEVRNGTILYQFDLGGGRARLTNPNWKVNDGEWHELQVHRTNRTGYMFFDEDENSVGPVDAVGAMTQLAINDDIAIGGYHDVLLPVSDVTLQGFDGCIKDVRLQLGVWDLNENIKSKGVSPGCPEEIARVASFTDKKLSFVKKVSEPIGSTLDITFKFKTTQKEALLIFIGNQAGDVGFSISLMDGKISVVSDAGGEKQDLMSRVNTYNDGRWHYVSVMRVELGLQMNIDDYEMTQQLGKGTKKSLDTDTAWYFGNADIQINQNLAASTAPLDGCIGDVTINGEFVNFALIPPTDMVDVSLAGCHIAEPEGPYDRVVLPTDLPPLFELTPAATTAPPPKSCALSDTPPLTLAAADLRGTYFGQIPNSRLMYENLPASIRVRSKFSWEFRTTAEDGVMMYMADHKHKDHISATINKGRIRYTYDCGTGMGEIISPNKYNDGKWHTLELGRNMQEGSMMIDGNQIGFTRSAGRGRSINKVDPYHFGGLPTDTPLPADAVNNLGGITQGFRGCLSNIQLNDLDMGVAPVQQGISNCSDLTEAGAYYHGNGGYIKLNDSFNVGRDLTLSVQIRPRTKNGVIFSIHGEMDFVLLQMVDGQLMFSVDNGGGSIIAVYSPEMDTKLCDGSWHTVNAVKDKHILSLTVDNNPPVETTGNAKVTSADTKNPIYLGGKPDAIVKGVRAKSKYRGCIRELTINGQYQYISQGVAFEDVQIGMCPVN